MSVAGWYADPAGSGRRRYFDGVHWTQSYLETVTTVYSAPTSVESTPKPAGWYPDPAGSPRRRYWDGEHWTESFAEQEIVASGIPHALKVSAALAALFPAIILIGALRDRDWENVAGTTGPLLVCALIGWGIWLAFRYDKRRKQRQQNADRARALAINADIEDAAYLQGDDERGMYGQFQLPPELRNGDR